MSSNFISCMCKTEYQSSFIVIYVKQPIHIYPVFPYILLYFRLMLYKEGTCCNKHFIYYRILNESEHQFLELWEITSKGCLPIWYY